MTDRTIEAATVSITVDLKDTITRMTMYYFQKYFGDHMVGSTVLGNFNVVSYASSFSSGESGIVLVNKGTTPQTVDLKMENYPDAMSYYRYVLTGGTDNGDFSRQLEILTPGAYILKLSNGKQQVSELMIMR